jgi:hypothetical protein
LKLKGTHQLLACADDVNTVGENIGTLNKITQDASKEAGLEVTPEKTKCMLMPSYKKAEQKHGIKRANMSFEDVANFKYLGTTLTQPNLGNASYRSV